MKRELRGRRVLITGATGAIGRELCLQAAAAGARLAVTGRTEERLDELERELTALGGEVLAIRADLTREDDRQAIVDAVRGRWGGLDVLVNNAGVGSHGHFATSDESVMRQLMELNFFAPAELMRSCLPMLREGVQPAIVNLVSLVGRCGIPAMSEYSASKFALAGLTEALRGEMARFDVHVMSVLPGLTAGGPQRRQMLRHEGRMKLDYEHGLPAAKVAAAVWGGLARGKAEVILGRDATWILRVQRIFPWFVDRMLARKVRQLYANG